jgi:hypothetical protein
MHLLLLQVVGQAAASKFQARCSSKSAQLPGWLDGSITACSRLGSKATTAQVTLQTRQDRNDALLLASGCCTTVLWLPQQ